MATDDLDMMQISDSMFPTGLFATSSGIEAMFFDKKITTEYELLAFNRIMIEQQMGPCECVIVSDAYDYARSEYEKIIELDAMCCAIRTNRESREASVRSGNQMIRCVREFLDDNTLDKYAGLLRDKKMTGSYPVAFGICCNAMQIGKEKSLRMFLYGFVASTVGASMRLGMIQHFEGQRIIHKLKPLMAETAKNGAETDHRIWQFAPQAEIYQMRHERMNSRMFVT